jgi:putative two-component system response regulator
MAERRIRHVPVVGDGEVVGMISTREIIGYQASRDRAERELAIFAVAKLAESRDADTGGHLERVCEYASTMAMWLAEQRRFGDGIDAEFAGLLHATGALHDIGKVGIPDFILLKPGRLTEREYEIMKTHAAKGAETLDLALRRFPDARFLQMGRDVAAHHHERVDGTGYPDGLKGEQIPLSARIFALADVYDALVSRRVYKEAFLHDVARNIILEGSGSQFDERVVEAFGACEEAFAAIRGRYSEAKAAA